jgi:hypothetical protein
MAVDEYVAQRFTQKFRFESGVFNGLAFIVSDLIPSHARFRRLYNGPSAEFSGYNPEYFAGAFLGNTVSYGFFDNIYHGFFDLFVKMAG